MEPFRFMHAGRLLVDSSLRGLGAVPNSIRPIVADATLLAWENLIESSLASPVDFLLVAGDDSELIEQGLRGRASFVHGLERLIARGITVVIAGGANEQANCWPNALRLPDGVVRLDRADAVAVRRDETLLAVIRSEVDPNKSLPGEEPRLLKLSPDEAFQILACSGDNQWSSVPEGDESTETSEANYFATGGGTNARTTAIGSRMLHDPGPLQAISPLETGPRGCALVSVDESGKWERTFVPTAPVRFESIHLTVVPEQTRDDLLLEMIVALERLPRYPSDRVWLLSLDVTGAGPCLQLLGDEREKEAFLSLFHADHGIRDVQVHVHTVRLHPTATIPAEKEVDDDLIRRFDSRLAERIAHPQWALEQCLDESRLQGGPWAAPLRSFLAELDAGEIADCARQLGREWFAAEEEVST